MLRLTRTAIGLLTRQYRSVLKKCWLINVGAWLFGAIGKTATTLLSQTLRGILKMSDTEIFKVTDGLSEKRVFKTKLITSTAIGLMVATMAMPSDAEASLGIAVEGEIDGYNENTIYDYYYTKYTRSGDRSNFLDVQTSLASGKGNGPYFDLETFLVDLSEGRLFVAGAITNHDIITGAVTDDKIASGITASKITQNASYRFVSDTEKATWNGYATTIAGKADMATTLSGYGITDAYTKTQVDSLISGSGSSYTAGTGISLVNKVISLDSNYLDNNYYRKNKKSGILNGVKEGKIGHENDDSFSKLTANDNFASKNGGFVLNNDSFLTNNDNFVAKNGDFATKNLSRLGAFSKCGKACSRPSERFPASLEKNSAFEQYSRSARGTFLFVSQTHKNVLDNFSKLTANDNFATTTFLRAI